jgi:colicin import membrane protein
VPSRADSGEILRKTRIVSRPSGRFLAYNPRPENSAPSLASNVLSTRNQPQEVNVEQAQLELQLKVWKELAISKQVLMRSATDALKLDPNCSQEELKVALDAVIKKIAEADSSVAVARAEAKQAITEMEKKLTAAEKARIVAEAAAEEIRVAQENASRQIEIERANFSKEMQQMKSFVAEKDKAVKAINAALADTPENVVKKLKALRKEKQDEADGRRQAEATMGTLRKEKQQADEQLTKANDKNAKLVTAYTETHGLATKLHEQLKPLLADEKDLPALPELDKSLTEEASSDDKGKNGNKTKK